ncbi:MULTISPECIES: DUF4019 domain-containing protein [Pseudoalteromonas]|uniref:DUF4019 domain-containing protein n=1 Tax=Pseudoalteromonas haloplanktis TaxID=228 RepID=A0ABU1BAU6_PSEHA|nr:MULTISPECIES: DUF4019 domain-containing protein [Pseudoalteromonas]MCF6143796.1 hypothetical protein [Pseudoalteromonas mariniglutinosa NCIMB 1770]MDQ9091044.1 DUF4019 domain-containing protein [Pseudoalteromonas haloplanktis]TMN69915.1 DUF4019 domain-containing protein [Pseudoalteromonas sp. S1727]
MKNIIVVLCLFISTLTWAQTLKVVDVATEIAPATSWLEVVDSGKYANSWQQAGVFFQENVPKALWVSKLEEVRAPLGKVQSRQGISRQELTAIPQLPDGEYVILEFQTDFENKADSIETVTLKKSAEQWQVIGYFIQ